MGVLVHGDHRGLATLACGLAGRLELSVQTFDEQQHSTGVGRALIQEALGLFRPIVRHRLGEDGEVLVVGETGAPLGWQGDVVGVDRAVLFRLATSERLERATKTLSGGDAVAWRAASRYVAGRTREEGLHCTHGLLQRGHGVSVDLFGELLADLAVVDRVVQEYLTLAGALPPPPADVWLSVDLTHLALDGDPTGAADRLAAIAAALPAGRRVQVGAEDAARTDVVLACVLEVARRGLADRLGATVQANLLSSPADADALTDAGVHIRLVKGAYLEATGTHPHGEATDIAFLRLGHRLAATGATWSMATHDSRLREALLLALGPVPVEQLLGVRPEVLDGLRDRALPTRVYVPYGPDWFRYWLRRVAESRGA